MTDKDYAEILKGLAVPVHAEPAMDRAIELLEQEPFMNKTCVAHQICHEDKVKVLDKIKTEIEQIEINGHIRDVECFRAGINVALNVINKYKNEGE